jgi:predicted nucleotide-binding protein
VAPPPVAPAASTVAEESNKVYVVGDENDPLRQQLSMFLDEIGLKEITVNRQHGTMLALDELEDRKDAKYAFFIFNSDDLSYAMFELGHFVGKLGKGRVCVLHMTDVNFPKNVPGVSIKPIVVKLEEASLSIIKELKAAGVKVAL